VPQDDDLADDLIPGSLKRKTYGEIRDLAAADPPDLKARQMRKLIEQTERLQQKGRRS